MQTEKHLGALTARVLLILTTTATLLSGCADLVSDSVVGRETLADRRACALALADKDIDGARVACLVALEKLAAGFGE